MKYHNITTDDMNNGDGLRVVLWLSGCSHHCKNCQNPQTWNVDSGIPFDDLAIEELFNELSKDYISGITFSGGDPLHDENLKELLNLITKIKTNFPLKTIWLYTGYTWEEILKKDNPEDASVDDVFRYIVATSCDVLVDGRYIDSKRDITLKWRGSSNQRVINVLESMKQDKVVLHCD